MKLPVDTKPALWGFAAGAAALAIVGFSWGGWVTGGKAEAAAQDRAEIAVVEALAPFCVAKFQQAADAEANMVEFKKIDPWSQGRFVEKGGWATLPGSDESRQVTSVANACAVLLGSA